MNPSCPFCDKIQRLGELPGDELVWQFPNSVALLGPWQFYTGYCILVARSHVTELHRMPRQARVDLFEEMMILSQAMELTFSPRKLNCESLGNQVPHVHWHLFPRSAEDPDTLKPAWLAIDRAEKDEEKKRQLQSASLSRVEIVSRLREALKVGTHK